MDDDTETWLLSVGEGGIEEDGATAGEEGDTVDDWIEGGSTSGVDEENT